MPHKINIVDREKITQTVNQTLDVFYHELLHLLINESETYSSSTNFREEFENIAQKLKLPYNRNEEPLIHLLAPSGYLSERLGLIQKADPENLVKGINDNLIRESAQILLDYLKNYNWANPKVPIIEYLKRYTH